MAKPDVPLDAPWMTRKDRWRFRLLQYLLTPLEISLLSAGIYTECQRTRHGYQRGTGYDNLMDKLEREQDTRRRLYYVFSWLTRNHHAKS